MDRWKSRGGKSQRGGEEERRSEKRKSEKKEDAGARKGGKAAIHCVSPMICGSGGSKSRLGAILPDEKHISKSKVSKTDGPRPLLEVEMSKKCTPLWREAHFQVQVCKTHHARTTFGS